MVTGPFFSSALRIGNSFVSGIFRFVSGASRHNDSWQPDEALYYPIDGHLTALVQEGAAEALAAAIARG
jgi:hypothetical protein